jgi:hypothetical protein
VMEMVEGDDLRRLLLRGPKLSYARIATWARQVRRGLVLPLTLLLLYTLPWP